MTGEQGVYRIAAVVHMTGVSAHALRAWERRYDNLEPIRTPTGLRLYSERQVERLRLIRALLDHGHAIGVLAPMDTAELARLLLPSPSVSQATAPVPDLAAAREALTSTFTPGFLMAMATRDLDGAERLLEQVLMAFSPVDLVERILVPLMTEVGLRWQRGSMRVAEEHAIAALVRSHMGAAMRTHRRAPGAPTALATTPAGELHELGALFAAFLAATHGWNVEYLGPNLPAEGIAQAAAASRVQVVLLSVIWLPVPDALREIRTVRALLPDSVRLFVGGSALQGVPLPEGAKFVAALEMLPDVLAA